MLCTFGNVLLLLVAYKLLRALSNFDIAQLSANNQQVKGHLLKAEETQISQSLTH
jgi:hypothetical protein